MRTPISRIESIAGAFVILAVLALLALVFVPGIREGRFLKAFPLVIAADDGVGLAAGDKLVAKGIQIGEVTRLDLDDANRVVITCKVYSDYAARMKQGTQVVLVPPAVMGSPRILLTLGSGPRLEPGAQLEARMETSMFDHLGEMADSVGGTLERVNSLLDGVNNELLPSMQRSVKQVEQGLEVFPQMALMSRDAMEDGRQVLESLKRTFLIRHNLPGEGDKGGMIPASYFEPIEDEE